TEIDHSGECKGTPERYAMTTIHRPGRRGRRTGPASSGSAAFEEPVPRQSKGNAGLETRRQGGVELDQPVHPGVVYRLVLDTAIRLETFPQDMPEHIGIEVEDAHRERGGGHTCRQPSHRLAAVAPRVVARDRQANHLALDGVRKVAIFGTCPRGHEQPHPNSLSDNLPAPQNTPDPTTLQGVDGPRRARSAAQAIRLARMVSSSRRHNMAENSGTWMYR